MRYHLFKVSKTRNLLISDSQGKGLDIANFNVLSLPGAKIEHVYNFIPKKNLYDIIVLHYDAKQGTFDCNRSVAVWCGFFTSITLRGFSRNEESGVKQFSGFLH